MDQEQQLAHDHPKSLNAQAERYLLDNQSAAPAPIPPEVIALAQSTGLGMPERTYSQSAQTARSNRTMIGWTIFVGVMMLPGIVLGLVFGRGNMTTLIISGVLVLFTIGMMFLMLSLGGILKGSRAANPLIVWGCPRGLVYRQKGQLHTLFWNDILAIRRKVGRLNGMMCTLAYIVRPATTPEFAFSMLSGTFSHIVLSESSGGSIRASMGSYQIARTGGFIEVSGNYGLTDYAGLGDLIEERMLEYRLPRALETYRAGTPINFGSLVVRQQGLTDSTRELRWSDINRVQVTDVSIHITKKPIGMTWFNLSAADTLNFVLLSALLNTIRNDQ